MSCENTTRFLEHMHAMFDEIEYLERKIKHKIPICKEESCGVKQVKEILQSIKDHVEPEHYPKGFVEKLSKYYGNE